LRRVTAGTPTRTADAGGPVYGLWTAHTLDRSFARPRQPASTAFKKIRPAMIAASNGRSNRRLARQCSDFNV
jgi:hypothetical protein